MTVRDRGDSLKSEDLLAVAGEVSGGAHSLYLTIGPDQVFAVLDLPDQSARTRTGVVIVPPFGCDELCAHRSLRRWARTLAANGRAALRIDLPGTGDSSGSPREPDRLATWTTAVAQAASWLRTQECDRIVAIGVGLGGMLALSAVSNGAPIDDLVLWAVPARGSSLLRELHAFAQMAGGTPDEDPTMSASREEGGLEVSGFVLTAETVAELGALDLTAAPIPDAARRRVLLLGRDSLAPDRRLRSHLERSGVALTVAEGPGYGQMLTHPQLAETPNEVIARSLAWLEAAPHASPPDSVLSNGRGAPASAVHADMRSGAVRIAETAFEFECDGKMLVGVLATPLASDASAAPITAVLLNAGAVRRIGPNRMWVETARRWAALGVPTLRLDAIGLGDSDGDERRYQRTSEFYHDEHLVPVIKALDELEARGLPGRFLLAGLCSSAYWSVRAALADDRVRALILVNLWSFVLSEELAAARDARRARALLRSGAWRDVARIAMQDGRIPRMMRTKVRQISRSGTGERDVLARIAIETDAILSQLRDADVQTLLLLSGNERLAEDLEADPHFDQMRRWPNIWYERVPIDDHIFRPVWAQRHVHGTFDRALVRACQHQRQGDERQRAAHAQAAGACHRTPQARWQGTSNADYSAPR